MKNILIFLFICFGFALNSQITITCYECKKNTTVDCKGCNIQSNLFTGIVIKEKGKPDIPLYEPYKVSNKSSVFTFEDAFGTKTIVNVTSVLSYNTPKKLYDYLSNCLCKPSTIDTDTDRYSVLIQDSILVTYDINGVEIDRDTIRLFDIDTDTKTFLVQDSILVYYDIQNNEIGRDTIKIPFVDTDIQTYLTQDSILVYYDESNTEIGRDTIRIPSIASITEQGDFRISNDTLYHNNSIDGIEQFVKLPSIDTTTQSYLPILNGLDTIGYENITYLGGVEVDRDTITLPLHKNQVQSNETQAVPYTGVELPTTTGVNIGDTNSTQFNDGTVVNYTWNGTAWVFNFQTSYFVTTAQDIPLFNFEKYPTGYVFQTSGFYLKEDGGAATYIIEEGLTSNGINIFTLSDGRYARYILNKDNSVNVLQLGAKGDDIFDNSVIFEKGIDILINGGELIFPEGTYRTSEPIIVKYSNTTLNSYGAIIKPLASWNQKLYSSGFLKGIIAIFGTSTQSIYNINIQGFKLDGTDFSGDPFFRTSCTKWY
jgi:hypothetical protein